MKSWASYVVFVVAVAAWMFVLDQLAGCKAPERDARVVQEVPNAPRCVAYHGKHGRVSFCLRETTLSICTPREGCLSVRVQPALER